MFSKMAGTKKVDLEKNNILKEIHLPHFSLVNRGALFITGAEGFNGNESGNKIQFPLAFLQILRKIIRMCTGED